jgi:hypothetical protein
MLEPGAVLTGGTVDGGNPAGAAALTTLELQAGSSVGRLLHLGTNIVNFGSIAVDAGARWNIGSGAIISAGETLTDAGTLGFVGGLANSGSIVVDGGTLFLFAGNTGTGDVLLENHAVDHITGNASGSLQFLDATGRIDLNTPAGFSAVMSGFVHGDLIDLINTPVTSITWTSPGLVVSNGSTTEATLQFAGTYSQSSFTFTSDGHNGTFIKHT